MKLVVDANIPAIDTCLARFGEVVRRPGRQIGAPDLIDADALIVRSVTQVNAELLADSKVSFVGSCTIGTDHVDLDALAASGVTFASAPGCNAEAVVDHVLVSLLNQAERDGQPLLSRRIGIIGAGNVGGRLYQRLNALGADVLVCDPPREEIETAGYQPSDPDASHATEQAQTLALQHRRPSLIGASMVTLERLLDSCDVVCLHTPLQREGPYPSAHLLDAKRIDALKPGTVLLNAGRGECIDTAALSQRLRQRADLTALLDVWETEPEVDCLLFRQVTQASPHVAGYSLDGKLRGTLMIQQALATYLGQTAEREPGSVFPPPAISGLRIDENLEMEQALTMAARLIHDPRRDHAVMHREVVRLGMAQGFDQCRANYPQRREFSSLEVMLGERALALAAPLKAAGFRVCRQQASGHWR